MSTFGHAVLRNCSLILALAPSASLAPAADVWVTGPSHKVARPEKAPSASEIWDRAEDREPVCRPQ